MYVYLMRRKEYLVFYLVIGKIYNFMLTLVK